MTPLLAALAVAAAAPSQVQFRVTTQEVLVDVVVTRDGEPVAGLVAEDFTLRDEGESRAFRIVPQADLPLSVLFLMDLSTSVTEERARRLEEAAARFGAQLTARDRCAHAVFAGDLRLVGDFGDCAGLDAGAAPDQAPARGTALRDALILGSALVEGEPGRPVIVVFTDGQDTASWIPEGLFQDALRGMNVLVYGVIPPDATGTARTPYRYRQFDPSPPSVLRRQRIGMRRMNPGAVPDALTPLLEGPRRNMRSRSGARPPSELQLLRHAAEGSGGRIVRTRDEERLAAAYEEILEEMQARYVLAFEPDPAQSPGWRRLGVTVGAAGATVRHRAGYTHRP